MIALGSGSRGWPLLVLQGAGELYFEETTLSEDQQAGLWQQNWVQVGGQYGAIHSSGCNSAELYNLFGLGLMI